MWCSFWTNIKNAHQHPLVFKTVPSWWADARIFKQTKTLWNERNINKDTFYFVSRGNYWSIVDHVKSVMWNKCVIQKYDNLQTLSVFLWKYFTMDLITFIHPTSISLFIQWLIDARYIFLLNSVTMKYTLVYVHAFDYGQRMISYSPKYNSTCF